MIFIIDYLQEYYIQVCCIMDLYLYEDKNARQATAIYLQILKTMAARVEYTPPPLFKE